jgi:hypothetical protein
VHLFAHQSYDMAWEMILALVLALISGFSAGLAIGWFTASSRAWRSFFIRIANFEGEMRVIMRHMEHKLMPSNFLDIKIVNPTG